MQSKLPLLPSGPGGVRKSTFHGPWRNEFAAPDVSVQEESILNCETSRSLAGKAGHSVRAVSEQRVSFGGAHGVKRSIPHYHWGILVFEPGKPLFLREIKQSKNSNVHRQKVHIGKAPD